MIFEYTRKKPRLDILPMIDVIFFLLVFFMLFTTFRDPNEAVLELDLPRAVTGTQNQPSPMVVSVDKQGNFFLDGVRVDGSRLQADISNARQRNPDLAVVVRGDNDVNYGKIVAAMDYVRAAGVHRLRLAVETPSP